MALSPLFLSLALSLTACGDKDDTGTDDGSTDGGSADGGSTDGGSADGGSTDGGSTDGGSTDGGSTDGGSTDGGSTDGGSTDGGSTDGGSSDGGSGDEVDPLDFTTGIELLTTDIDQFAGVDYTWNTYAVTSDFETPFTTADGLQPRFHVIWPTHPGDGDPYPVLMQLHGASTDVDDVKPEGDNGRCNQANGIEAAEDIVTRSAFVQQALYEGFVVVVPENGFCDGWAGFGPDDPNDTTHAGYYLERVAMGFMRWGQTHLAVDADRVYVVGTSLGATGSPNFPNNYPYGSIAGLIYDSGAPDFVRYTEEKGYSGVDLEVRQERGYHIMGGSAFESDGVTPSSLYDRYLRHSLDRAMTEGVMDVPAFVIANAQDPVAPSDMYDGIETAFADAGVDRWTYHDVDHADPGHTQINSPSVPFATHAAVRFALGRHVAFVEAEGHSGDGWIGEDVLDESLYDSASGGDVRLAGRGATGTLVELSLPDDAVGDVAATLFLTITGAGDTGATAVSATLSSGADGTVDSLELAQDSAEWNTSDGSLVRERLLATRLEGTLTEGGTVTVELSGMATVAMDVVVVDWD